MCAETISACGSFLTWMEALLGSSLTFHELFAGSGRTRGEKALERSWRAGANCGFREPAQIHPITVDCKERVEMMFSQSNFVSLSCEGLDVFC